jgi:hypothetical protein
MLGCDGSLITQGGKKVSLPVKTQGDSYSSGNAKSEYDNQIALSPTNIKGERIKVQNGVFTKKYYTRV